MSGLRLIPLMLVAALAACDRPIDELFEPPVSEPIETYPGVFRVTFNPGPDLVRGFTPDGRIIYRSQGLVGSDDRWRLLSVAAAGGSSAEEARTYTSSLGSDSAAAITFDANGRVLAAWKPATHGVHTCGDPAPRGPLTIALALLRLDPEDGLPLSSVPKRQLMFRNSSVQGSNRLVRHTPADLDARAYSSNPFGPAVPPDGSGRAVVSDGEALWRVALADSTVPPDSIGPGAFPAVSADGSILAAAVPVGLDSTVDTTVVSFMLGVCIQVTVTSTVSGWTVVLYDLAGGGSTALAPGTEPVFHPDGDRIVVRRPDALYWVDLADGSAAMIPGTEGGTSPSISPDGGVLAFSAPGPAGHDVFLIRLE